ncbi:hypothetical protein STEG23_000356 [Scotinomys teguina]
MGSPLNPPERHFRRLVIPMAPEDLTLSPILRIYLPPSGLSHFLRPRNIQTLLEEWPQSLPKTQEQPDTFGGREPRSIQTPLEEASLPRTKEHPDTIRPRGPRSIQSPLEEEDPEAPRHLWRKRTKEHQDTTGPRGPKSTQTSVEEERPQALPRTQEHPDTFGGRVTF